MKVYYWCPFISKVATVTAVLNSIKAIKKYSAKKIDIAVINVFKEWDNYNEEFDEYQIESIKFNNLLNIKYLPKNNFFKSRFTYIITFLFSVFSLHNLLKKKEPNFLIIHLISSIPLFLLIFFNYKTKFILRISGYPKLNFLRNILWKIAGKKLDKIFCPTELTKNYLISKKIFPEKKMFVLHDPIIDIKKIRNSVNRRMDYSDDFLKNTNYVVSIGRLSKQKNYNFMIKNFKKITKFKNIKLVIIGEGEQEKFLKQLIVKENLQKKIFLIGSKKNIYPYLANSLFFILSSNWEDPGFVIVESMISRKIVLSSNCSNGPKELITNSKNGFLYKKNDSNDFMKKFDIVMALLDKKEKKNYLLLNALKTVRKYSIFNHYLEIKKHFEEKN